MLEITNTVTEMRHAFDGLTSRLDTAEESVSLKIGQQITPRLKYKEKRGLKKKIEHNIQKLYENFKMYDI